MKTYTVKFTSGNPTTTTGLAPTLSLFARADTGATLAAPSFTEAVSGWGIYQFQWGTTTPIIFLADGMTTSLGSNRWITGQLDPADRADEYGNTMIAIGTTLVAIGTSLTAQGNSIIAAAGPTLVGLVGNLSSAIGDANTDPSTLFGYLKRALEVMEGQQTFTKLAGSWNILDRTGATTLRTRTISNSASTVIRS